MFEKLFAKYRAISRYKNSPLLEERLQYLEHCAKQGMSIRALKEVATYQLIVIEFLHLDSRQNETISNTEILEKAECWSNRDPPPSNLKDLATSRRRFIKHATRWLAFMKRLSPTSNRDPPYQPYLDQ